MTLEKWVLNGLKRVLKKYDSQKIYRVYIKKQKKVIQIKNLCIFDNYKIKAIIKLLDYDNSTPTFQEIFWKVIMYLQRLKN